ncbi:hypothetical protein AAVH_13008 [Aphelenchoides avenae]|nr:hypothetical protein AAVH_13008 [Aphelenchus avenae]
MECRKALNRKRILGIMQVEHPMNEISAERACPSVHCIEPGPLEAQEPLAEPPPAEIDLLRTPKRELDEDVDVELLDDPPLPIREHRSSCASPSTTTTPSLPTLAASSSAANASVPVAYFGDAVFDRPSDPSSFTYESDVYGSFKFVLLDEVEKEEGGQISIVRLYQCKACLARKYRFRSYVSVLKNYDSVSQTHEYKDEVVHTIVTYGQRIVKYDPATPRGQEKVEVRGGVGRFASPAAGVQ